MLKQFSPSPAVPAPRNLSGWCRSALRPHPSHSLATPDARIWSDFQPAVKQLLVQSPVVKPPKGPCLEIQMIFKMSLGKLKQA